MIKSLNSLNNQVNTHAERHKISEIENRHTYNRNCNLAILIVLIGHVAVATLYVFLIPSWLPYDEPSHFYYAAHLAGFPNFVDHGSYEMNVQPPLAYLVYAPFLKIASGFNVIIQLIVARFVTVVESTIVVWLNMLMIKKLIGNVPCSYLILAAAGSFVAFNPSFLAVGSSVNNDTMLYILVTAALLLSLKLLEIDSEKTFGRGLVGVGTLVGLAACTQALALPLLIFPLIIVLIKYRTFKVRLNVWLYTVIALIISFSIASPFYLSVGAATYMQTVTGIHPTQISEIPKSIAVLFATTWGFVNYLRDVLPNKPKMYEYLPFLVLSLTPLAALVKIVWKRNWSIFLSSKIWLIFVFVFLTLSIYIYRESKEYSPEGRLLFGAIGIFGLSIAFSLYYVIPNRFNAKEITLIVAIGYVFLYSIFVAIHSIGTAPQLFQNLYQ